MDTEAWIKLKLRCASWEKQKKFQKDHVEQNLISNLNFVQTFLFSTVSADEGSTGKKVELSEEHLMQVIEAAYPNPVTMTELAKDRSWNEEELNEMFSDLQERGLVHPLADQPGTFTRAAHNQTDVVQVSFKINLLVLVKLTI
jgi:hypothetical protein